MLPTGTSKPGVLQLCWCTTINGSSVPAPCALSTGCLPVCSWPSERLEFRSQVHSGSSAEIARSMDYGALRSI